MTVVPVCPIHGQPMNESQYGGFYCKKKNPDGSWCKQKVAPGGGQTLAQVAPPAPALNPALDAPPDAALAVAALHFAGRVYAGTSDSTNALALAALAYDTFQKVTR